MRSIGPCRRTRAPGGESESEAKHGGRGGGPFRVPSPRGSTRTRKPFRSSTPERWRRQREFPPTAARAKLRGVPLSRARTRRSNPSGSHWRCRAFRRSADERESRTAGQVGQPSPRAAVAAPDAAAEEAAKTPPPAFPRRSRPNSRRGPARPAPEFSADDAWRTSSALTPPGAAQGGAAEGGDTVLAPPPRAGSGEEKSAGERSAPFVLGGRGRVAAAAAAAAAAATRGEIGEHPLPPPRPPTHNASTAPPPPALGGE